MKTLIWIVIAGWSAIASAVTPEVRNIKAFQQGSPWGHICISYEVVGDVVANAGSGNTPILVITAKDKTTGKLYGEVSSAESYLSGDTGTSAGQHKVIWDVAEQGLTVSSDNVTFTVAYGDGVYIVVDLSSGASSSSYPVSYLYGVPSGGWTDAYKTTKLVLKRILPGSFKMGSQHEVTRHDVTLTKPFYMGVFEMTQEQYGLVMGIANPSLYRGDKRPVEQVLYDTIRGSSHGVQWPSSSAVDSTSFMGKMRARTGLDFDLPTEAQWEYACRAGTTSSYNNGCNSENDLKNLGRYYGNCSDGKGGYSEHTTVGSYLPNAWGLYDMHGNVSEWCLDWYGDLSDATDPKGSTTWSKSGRVVRGGSWGSSASNCTSSYRRGYKPSGDIYVNYSGFRLCLTLSN